MKGIKLSKAGWLLLSAGVFVVILAGLGMTRSQQVREHDRMTDELVLVEARLAKADTAELRRQLADLQQKIEVGRIDYDEASERLRQTVISVDVTEELFSIADYSGVTIMRLATSAISPNELEGIGLSTISLNTQATGDIDSIIDFVINLNNGFSTGYVASAQISVPFAGSEELSGEEPAGEEQASVSIQMVVYSYEKD